MANNIVKCFGCKQIWTTKLEKMEILTSHRCENLVHFISQEMKNFEGNRMLVMIKLGADNEIIANNKKGLINYCADKMIYIEPIKYIKPKVEKTRKCSAKCMSALSPSCDCLCKAENHGMNHNR